jgi:predicted nucleic acid-binding protein
MVEKVVDASVAAKWFLPEAYKDNAQRLLTAFLNDKLQLIAPDFMAAEVANLLWTRSTARKEISEPKAAQSLAEFLALGLDLRSNSALLTTALKLGASEKHSVYDMIYIALAQQENREMITADEKLINKLHGKYPLLRWIGDF